MLATLDEFEEEDILGHAAKLSAIIEQALVKLSRLPAIATVRGEGTVWGIECAAVGDLTPEEVAHEIVRRCYLGDDEGYALHLLGPLSGKVIRIAPPLTMDLGEAQAYFEAMDRIIAEMGAG